MNDGTARVCGTVLSLSVTLVIHKLCHKGICSHASHLSAGFVNSVVVLVNLLALPVNVPATMFALPYFSVDKPCRSLTMVFQERVSTTGNFLHACVVGTIKLLI